MTYNEFIDYVMSKVKEELCDDCETIDFYQKGFTSDDPKMIEWIKDSNLRFAGEEGTVLLTDCLVVKKKDDSGVINTQYIAARKLYEEVKTNGVDAVLTKVSKTKNTSGTSADQQDKSVYESIRDQLILRPLNYSLHIRELKGCVYKRIGDFALVLYQLLSNKNKMLATRKIQRDELKYWNMEEKAGQVMQDALENSAKLFPACAFDYSKRQEVDFLTADFSRKDITMAGNYFLISTFNTINGAMALFYPGVVEKLMKMMGGAFIAVFMNINDIMICDLDDPMAKQFAKTAGTSGPMGEMLSKRCYRCDETGFHVL